jgi:predicted transcriptional regulator of viral defense system
VTTIERTIVDLFDRYDLAGGPEELVNSLDLVVRVDTTALIRYARTLGNASAAGALGSWLERNRVPDRALDQIRKLASTQARYALGARSREGRTAKDWNVILPLEIAEPCFEGL